MSAKALIGICTVGVSMVGSAIAFPLALNFKSYVNPITMKNFPSKLKESYKGGCQALMHEGEEKYLLVCAREEEAAPEFYFYSGSEKLLHVSAFRGAEETENGEIEVTLALSEDGINFSGEEKFLVSPAVWMDSLQKTGISRCKLKNKSDEHISWILHCGSGGDETPDINLIPLKVN